MQYFTEKKTQTFLSSYGSLDDDDKKLICSKQIAEHVLC